MPLSSKVLKRVNIVGSQPKEISLRNDFIEQPKEEEMDPAALKYLNWAKQEAQALISKAQSEAEEILIKAQTEGESIKAQALEEGKKSGYEAGYQAGYEEGLRKYQILMDELNRQKRAVIEELKQTQQKIYQDNEQAMVALAYKIAEKIIRKQVELDRTVITGIVKNVLKEARAGESYLIFVNPADMESVSQAKNELLALLPPGATLQLLADPDISPGGCRLETNLGFTDGTIENQLAEVKKALNLS